MLVPIEKHFTSTRRILIIYRYIMYLLGFNFPQAAPGIPWDELAVGSDFKRSWDTKYLGQTSDPKSWDRTPIGMQARPNVSWDRTPVPSLLGCRLVPTFLGTYKIISNVSWFQVYIEL